MTAIAAGSALDGRLALSVRDASYALNISRAQLYVLIAEGKLNSLKVGRRRLFERREIDGFLASHRVEGCHAGRS